MSIPRTLAKTSLSILFGFQIHVASAQVPSASEKSDSAKASSMFGDEQGADTLAGDYMSNSPSAIQARIRSEIEKKCDESGCTIAAIDSVNKGWKFGLNFGTGNGNNTAGTIYVIGNQQPSNDGQYVGASISYENMHCSTKLKIENEWFTTMASYGAYARSKNPADFNEPVPVAKPDTKFFALVYTEFVKQLNQAGCKN